MWIFAGSVSIMCVLSKDINVVIVAESEGLWVAVVRTDSFQLVPVICASYLRSPARCGRSGASSGCRPVWSVPPASPRAPRAGPSARRLGSPKSVHQGADSGKEATKS